MKLFFLYGLILIASIHKLYAQPVNDDCVNAIPLVYGISEDVAIKVSGNTTGATASVTPAAVCSGSFYSDDIWYKFTAPSILPGSGIIIKAFYNNLITSTDVNAIGMAVYAGCGETEISLRCFSSEDPEENSLFLAPQCLQADHEYWVRIWSSGNTTATEGTFKIAVFGQENTIETILWEETFGDSLDGWITYGTCHKPDSNLNAKWEYLREGLLDKGHYAPLGFGLQSNTVCNGGIGVDADYNTSLGTIEDYGGPCEVPAIYILESPVIYAADWNTQTVTIRWTQAIRQFMSRYYISYRTRDSGNDWSEWFDIEVNREFSVNSDIFSNNVQLHLLPSADGHDSLQLRFTYNANYYMWGLDDIQLIGDGYYHDLTFSSTPAIIPWASMPWDQGYPFYVMSSVYNSGSEIQTNVRQSVFIVDQTTEDTLSRQTIVFDSIRSNENENTSLFPDPIVLPSSGQFEMIWKIEQDQSDLKPADNIHINHVGSGEYLQLEDGFTRSVSVATNLYEPDAPLAYAYGSVYRPNQNAQATSIRWGVSNADDLEGMTLLILLIEWQDLNGDYIAQPSERTFIGYNDYLFTGDEPHNFIHDSWLQHFTDPGNDVFIYAGRYYLAMVEYKPLTREDPQLFMLASEDRDYNHIVASMDTAFIRGLVDHPIFMTALGFSPNGNIENIDYQVRELDPTDDRIHFGDHIVPLVRVSTYTPFTKGPPDSPTLLITSPNPVSNTLTIAFQNQSLIGHVSLQLVDASGKNWFQKNETPLLPGHIIKIEVEQFPAGAYTLSVIADQIRQSIPIAIVH